VPDEEKLIQFKAIWVTKEVYDLIKEEKKRLKDEGRKVSMQKIANRILYEGLIN